MLHFLTTKQRLTLKALVNLYIPSLQRVDDQLHFWSTSGSDVDVVQQVEQRLANGLQSHLSNGLIKLIDIAAALQFAAQPIWMQHATLRTIAALGADASAGMQLLHGICVMCAYGSAPYERPNPFWRQWGYPNDAAATASRVSQIKPYIPSSNDVTLEADVVIVGSGAGGGVLAGVLAQQGRQVVVLEAGGFFSEADFNRQEQWALRNMFYRHGLAFTADGNVAMLAGATLGGGTTVNWQNCVAPSSNVRDEWARQYGLEEVDGPEFERQLGAILARIGGTTACSDFNGPHQRMQAAAKQLGYAWSQATLNVDPSRYRPETAGFTGFGDNTGSKQGTLRTFLQDAYDHGAMILARTKADRILVEHGQAAGVVATYTAGEHTASVTVRAATVVVACGALESPALLLRSGIGGPAVGKYLRLHPSHNMFGVYAEDQRPWWGPPQAGVMHEFAQLHDGYGYLVEGSQFHPGVFAFLLTHRVGLAHKEAMSKLGQMADFLFVLRDHGAGTVTIDKHGDAVHGYPTIDPLDQQNFHHGVATLARMHAAAGAQQILAVAPGGPTWTYGQNLERWIAGLQRNRIGKGGLSIGSAHQMGTCRMGRNPAESVADPWGQLHDVAGVWIGDTSAFPSAVGVNPMLTCMALAHRTAEAITGVRHDLPVMLQTRAVGASST